MTEPEPDQAGVPLVEALIDPDQPNAHDKGSKKRKRDAEGKSQPEEKKSKTRRKLKKPKDVDDSMLDVDRGVNLAIAHMDPQLMAEHVAQRTRRFEPDLTMVEAEERILPAAAIVDTADFTAPRLKENLPSFLEQFATSRRGKGGGKLSDASKDKGSPHTLVVCGAGLRAADLTRALRPFQTKDALVAKLFAKHIKLKEAIETVSTSRIGIGVGTPQRIMDLVDQSALKSTSLERIVVDASHIDQKKRGMLDMKETQIPLVKLLLTKQLRERYGSEANSKRVQLLFF